MSATPDRLYNLLPAVYRIRDTTQGERLRALLGIIQNELDALDGDIAGLYENWFIETCQEWVVPYIGDLLGARGLKPISGGTFTARPYIAHTLKYRRSKGTAAMLETLARDVTNWHARVVEFFELLDTFQYLNHLRPDPTATADFRDTNALELLGGPFEQASRTLEARPVEQAGKYNVPNLGIYLWRLESFPLSQTTARPVTDGSDGRYRFNPLGLDAPLFNQPQALAEGARVAGEVQVPGPLRRRALFDDLEALRQAIVDQKPPLPTDVNFRSSNSIYFGANPVLEVSVAGAPVPQEQIIICDLSDQPSPPGSWPQPPATDQSLPITVSVDPLLGRLFFTTSSIPKNPAQVLVNYSYGFSGNLGGGPYDRSNSMPVATAGQTLFQVAVTKQTAAFTHFATLTDAIGSWNKQAANTFGIIAILDSETYAENLAISIPESSTLTIVAADWPGLREGNPAQATLEPVGLRPHVLGNLQVTGTAAADSKTPGGLILNGLLIDGPVTVEPGNLGSLQLLHCTLRPSAGGLQVATQVQGAVAALAALHQAPHLAPLAAPVNKLPVIKNGGGGNGGPPPKPIKITTTSPLPTATAGAAYTKTFAATGGSGAFTWSADTLPAGLSLDASKGTLSGTPQAAGSFTLNINVDDVADDSGSKAFVLPVTAPLAIATTSPLPPATIGAAYSQTLAATGGSGVYSWTATGLPAWLSLSTGGVLTGTPPALGIANFTITVTDSAGVARSTPFDLSVIPPPLVITTTLLPGAATGVAYNQTLSGTGGQAPLTWSVSAGSLPPGLSLAASGAITGQPSAAGSFNFTVKLSDSAGSTPATHPFTMVITSGLTIATPPLLPAVTAGGVYSVTLAALGGVAPFTWSVNAGALPAGLKMDATGKIAGTPTAAGSFAFTAKVADSASGAATQAFTLVVAAAPIIAATPLANATQGAAYFQAVALTGGNAPFAWSVAAGALPAGITLDPTKGTLSGNPTASGSFSFTLQVKDSSAVTATQKLGIAVAPPLGIATAPALPGGTANVPYSATLATTGGTAPMVWSIISGSLPPGLSLSAAGSLAGTPQEESSSTFTAQVKDGAGASAAATFSLAIMPALTVATATLPAGEINIPYSETLAASGGTPPYTWSLVAGAPPSPLTFAVDGSIRGTPTAPSVTNLAIRCTDQNSVTATQVFVLTIAPPPAVVTPAALPTGVAGSNYSVILACSGGVPPFQWAVTAGALPPGLSIQSHAAISLALAAALPTATTLGGVPAAPGTFTVTLTATDSQGVSSSRQFTVIVIDDNPTLTVTLIRSICGPLSLDATAKLTVVDSIVDAAGGNAIAAPAADASIQTSTVVGAIGSFAASGARTLEADNSIFTAPVFVERRQTGCVRFCYVAPGSRTPRRYRSQPDLALAGVTDPAAQAAILARLAPLFTSLIYGQPGYAQLSLACAPEIRTGAEDGSEMGAFDFLKQPQREDNLRASLGEFLRFGMEAGIFFVT
jgi:hypothetical protein